ncbi:hypothetical protein HOLleu_24635 [Holothuria leucospilota]|uniref:P2X purinoreceptor 7 intracellular domain-containing protein n=1 Tax=Holothuria leucospilota TaxID=206669 RepID=A0A9Q1BRV9_HOLLE|nr:hypothetical protein HOLleu_24635 [Holothuria leucospilota]
MASRSSSISDKIDLDLSASSSSFDEEEVCQYEDVAEGPDEEPVRGNLPYQFEPLAEVVTEVAEQGADEQAVLQPAVTASQQYRYTAYRQFVRWCWGFLGRHVRVVLPACAVIRIRETFPSEEFVGFQYPNLD